MSQASVVSDVPTVPTFALFTLRLILLPTPLAIKESSYLDLYAHLHGLPAFCMMAFGPDFPVQTWDISQSEAVVQREISASWNRRGIGDFALGLIPDSFELNCPDSGSYDDFKIQESKGIPQDLDLLGIHWIGYVGVRDATTTSIPKQNPSLHTLMLQNAGYLPWQSMVELRYGLAPEFWGKGFGTEAAKAVMEWSIKVRGVQRFIAETEILNTGSKKILESLEFIESGTDYWGCPGTVDWEHLVDIPRASI